jgi:hypothetical protein
MVESRLGEILRGFVASSGFGRQMNLYRAYGHWEEIVGAEVARHVRPLRVERGVLWLVADSGVWAEETSFARPGILEALRRHGVAVREIRLRQGTLPRPEALAQMPRRQAAPPTPPGVAADLIRDPELRDAFASLAVRKEGDPPAPPHRE